MSRFPTPWIAHANGVVFDATGCLVCMCTTDHRLKIAALILRAVNGREPTVSSRRPVVTAECYGADGSHSVMVRLAPGQEPVEFFAGSA